MQRGQGMGYGQHVYVHATCMQSVMLVTNPPHILGKVCHSHEALAHHVAEANLHYQLGLVLKETNEGGPQVGQVACLHVHVHV